MSRKFLTTVVIPEADWHDLTATNPSLRIGATTGNNMIFSQVGIQVRTPAQAATTLFLNENGGQVYIGTGGLQVFGIALLKADPVGALEAATKQYVDTRVLKAGDTMTGPLNIRTGAGALQIENVSTLYSLIEFWNTGKTTRVAHVGTQSTDTNLRLWADIGNAYLGTTAAGTAIIFQTAATEAARIDGNNHFMCGMNTASITNAGFYFNANNQGLNSTTAAAGNPNLICNKAAIASAHPYVSFRNTNTEIGSITRNAATSAVLYNTSSDYRLKNDMGPIEDGLDRLRHLKPRRVIWKDDPTETEVDAFLAHEVAEVVPDAVTGAKDAVAEQDNEDLGLTAGDIIPQQLDATRLIPLLVAAVQDLTAQVTELRLELDALKS